MNAFLSDVNTFLNRNCGNQILAPIHTVLAHYYLTADRNNRLLCPWHHDKTLTLQMYPKTNTWTCFFSNCSAGSGDRIEFIQRMERYTKHGALLKTTELAGEHSVSPNGTPHARALTPLSRTAVLTKYYHSTLHAMQRSRKGRACLEGCGLDSDRLQTGYAGYDMGKRWNWELKASAEQAGLLKIRTYVIFPSEKCGRADRQYLWPQHQCKQTQ